MTTNEQVFTEEVTQEEVFSFLENLRESGVTNMFGAAPYISEYFDVNMSRARKMLSAWMESYK